MTIVQLVHQDRGLIGAFRRFSKRYLSVAKKPNLKKILPEIIYRTMRLEGEQITRKETQALFK